MIDADAPLICLPGTVFEATENLPQNPIGADAWPNRLFGVEPPSLKFSALQDRRATAWDRTIAGADTNSH